MTAAKQQLEEMLAFVLEDSGASNHRNAQWAMRRWYQFCAKIGLKSWRDCDVKVAIAWLGWLNEQGLSVKSILNVGAVPLRCLEMLQQMEPEMVHPEFVIPTAHFPRVSIRYRKPVMSPDRIEEVMLLCVNEVADVTEITRESLVPFVVLFCVRTGINVGSVLSLPRGCAFPDEGGHWIRWRKDRSKGPMREFHEPMVWGAVEVIHRLEALHEYPYVFSYREKPIIQFSDEVHAWCRKHGIRDFCPREIRSALATLMYQRDPKNIVAIQRFLQHKNLRTTLLYLAENVVRPINARMMVDAQEWMLERWGIPREDGR